MAGIHVVYHTNIYVFHQPKNKLAKQSVTCFSFSNPSEMFKAKFPIYHSKEYILIQNNKTLVPES